jgi:hypothetical protein
MHEGIPIIFQMERVFSRGKRKSELSSRTNYLGVMHKTHMVPIEPTMFHPATQERIATVYCEHSKTLHNTKAHHVKTLDGEQLKFDSLIEHSWRAWMKVIPPLLYVSESYSVDLLSEIEFRSRIIRLTQIPATSWPVLSKIEVLTWPAQACFLHPSNANIVQKDNIMLESTAWSEGVQSISRAENADGWVWYDPALSEQSWQPYARQMVEKTMKGYHALVVKKFPRLAKAMKRGGDL